MKKTAFTLFVLLFLSLIISLASCSGGAKDDAGGDFDGYYESSAPDASTPEGEGSEDEPADDKPDETPLPSGMITAAAWNDNNNYTDWLDLFLQALQGGEEG